MIISEIYLTKNYIQKDSWQQLINKVAKYNGFLKSFKIIVTNNNNEIRYFIKTNSTLPPTLNNVNEFLIKQSPTIKLLKSDTTRISMIKTETNIIDLINITEIKNKKFLYLEIDILKLYADKMKTKVKYYVKEANQIKKYRVLFAIPTNILSVDFEGNKRYFYQAPPKYLEIKKILHLLNTDKNNALVKVDAYPYLQENFYLSQNSFSFDKHSIVIGSSGCGKSKLISLLIYNIYKNHLLKQKYKFVIIDPHAALEEEIGGFSKVIDFQNKQDSIDLFMNHDDIVISSQLLLELFKSLIADQYNSKLERLLRHAIYLLLAENAFNFKNLKKLILDIEYRNNLIKKLKSSLPSSIIDFFLTDFNDLKTKSYDSTIAPIISFIDEMEMIPIFNEENESENIKDTIKNNFITLFSLDKTKLGEKVTKTISGLIIQQLLILAQTKQIEEHIIFIIDEVAVIENETLPKYLSESRKYNISLILISQYLSQVSDRLKQAIFANASNYFIFRVSKNDAMLLGDNMNIKIPTNDTKESKINMLTELNNRQCIIRCENNGILLPAMKATTLEYISIPKERSNNKNNTDTKPKTLDKKKYNFQINNNIILKDILAKTSSSRKVEK